MMGMDVSQAPPDRIDREVIPYFESFRRLVPGTSVTASDDPSRLKPGQIPGLRDVVDVKTAPHHVVALKKDGAVWAWGDDQVMQIGSAEQEPHRYPGLCSVVGEHQIPKVEQPRQTRGVDHVRQIFVADGLTALVKDDQSFWLVGTGCRLYDNFSLSVHKFKIETWAEVAVRGMFCQKVSQVTRLREAVDRILEHRFPPIRSGRGKGPRIDKENGDGRRRFRNMVSSLYLQGYDIQTREMRRNAPRNPKQNLLCPYANNQLDLAHGVNFTAFIRPEDEQIIRQQCASVDGLFDKAMADVASEDAKAVERWTLH